MFSPSSSSSSSTAGAAAVVGSVGDGGLSEDRVAEIGGVDGGGGASVIPGDQGRRLGLSHAYLELSPHLLFFNEQIISSSEVRR